MGYLFHSNEVKEYWSRKQDLTVAAVNEVNWDAIGRPCRKRKDPEEFLSQNTPVGCVGSGSS